jgi:hypothetical protein
MRAKNAAMGDSDSLFIATLFTFESPGVTVSPAGMAGQG